MPCRGQAFDPAPYRRERRTRCTNNSAGGIKCVLITEPYLGGGGSYHPPAAYLQMLQAFCRERDIIFILDEVQSNFGRTGDLFAFETYGLEPDIVVLGMGLGNGVPVAAAAGGLICSAHSTTARHPTPGCQSAVERRRVGHVGGVLRADVLGASRRASAVLEEGLVRLKELPFIAHVRGEKGSGMVWGVETSDYAGRTATEWANALFWRVIKANPAATAYTSHGRWRKR